MRLAKLLQKLLRRKGVPSSGTLTTSESGRAAQDFAERELLRRGFRIVARNLRDKGGELDLVLRHPAFDGVIVLECRAYNPAGRMRREDVVGLNKQQQVVKTARRLLPRKGIANSRDGLRFDVAIVELDVEGRPSRLDLIENAFTTDRRDWF